MGAWQTLAGRLTLAFIGLVALVTLTLALVLPNLARSHQLAVLEERLRAEAQMVAVHVAGELGRGRSADLDAFAKRLGQTTDARITIIAPDGLVLGESHEELSHLANHADRPEVQQALARGAGASVRHSETVGYDLLYVAVPIRQNGALLSIARVALPLQQVDRLATSLAQTMLVAALAGAAVAAALAVWLARRISRPIRALTGLANTLAEDPATVVPALPERGPDEVIRLSGALHRLAAAVRDNLARVRAERDRVDGILAELTDGVVLIAADGRIARLNPAAERLLGLAARQAVSRTLAEALRDHELVELVGRCQGNPALRLSPKRAPAAIFLERSTPRRFWRASATALHGGEADVLLVIQDLTEVRRLEAVRRDFVANVSHELRTPIAAIQAMVETLEDGAIEDREASRDFLARIQAEVDGLRQLVEELLELSRLESGRVDVVLAPTEPARFVQSAVRRLAPMAERAEVSLAVDLPSDLPLVTADAERMGQVLVNLVHNAIKFTPPGGTIVVRGAAEARRVRLSVVDTGVGIAPAVLPRVFERFYKADQARAGGGTGLGLAIAKHTVQLHAGAIWAESDGPGYGTAVHVSLPRAQ